MRCSEFILYLFLVYLRMTVEGTALIENPSARTSMLAWSVTKGWEQDCEHYLEKPREMPFFFLFYGPHLTMLRAYP